MSLTAGQKAPRYAQAKIARAGATRSGYTTGAPYILVAGVHVGYGRASTAVGVILESLSISDVLNDTPNTCNFRMHGTVPAVGAEVKVFLGSKNRIDPLFAGFALTVQQRYAADNPRWPQADCTAVDYTWLLGFVKVTAQYRNLSATAIAQDLIARFGATNGFSSAGVAANLPVLAEITFTNEDLPEALSRLAERIGAYWYVDYVKNVHLFFDEVTNGTPVTLTPTHRSLAHVTREGSDTQALSRVYVEGRGSTLLSAVLAGDTMVPIVAADMFTPAADVFAKLSQQGSDGGAQHVNFSGVDLGGRGSLVGPGAGPPGAPTLARAVGAGLSAGVYQYAYTFITASGESLPAPLATIDTSELLAPPATQVTLEPMPFVGGVDAGDHGWSYTNVAADGGETNPIAGVAASTAGALLAVPIGAITDGPYMGGGLSYGYYFWRTTYLGNDGGETTLSDAFSYQVIIHFGGSIPPEQDNKQVRVWGYAGTSPGGAQALPEGVVGVRYYRTTVRASYTPTPTGPWYLVADVAPNTTTTDAWSDAALVGQPQAPTTNTAKRKMQKVRISNIAPGPPGTVARHVYRSRLSDWEYHRLTTINDNVTTVYDDTTPDASLGAEVIPSVNTAGANMRQVQLSNIAVGPTSAPAVTQRKLYRTVAGGSVLKVVATLINNTTTDWLDALSDGGLGANAPSGDTSGIQQTPGQVPAGSLSIIVANPGVFNASGGWAVIGNGEQVIRYTGKSTNALTGLPASGVGAIVAAVAYNSTITAAPMITGVPASGARAITIALTKGDEIYLVVQSDSSANAAALAALGAGNGIREEWVQDRRLSTAEARARGLATLALRPLNIQKLRYTSRDLLTASGKTITAGLPAPTNISGTYRIQTVTITNFRPYPNQLPTYTVEASSVLFRFEDFLRLIRPEN